MPLDRGMNAVAIRTGQVQRVDDYQRLEADAMAQTLVVDQEPLRSVVAAPLMHRGWPLGSMGAIRRQVDPFTDHDVTLLETLAHLASIAVANALAYEELAGAGRRLQDAHSLGMHVLLEMSRHLQATTDMSTFFKRLSGTIAQLVCARRAAFFLYDGDHTLAAQREAFGFEPGALEPLVFPIDPSGDGLIEQVVFRDVVFRGDVSATDPAMAPYRAQLEALNVPNAIGVAWRAGEERLGLLAAYDSTRPDGFTEEDVLVLQTAALAGAGRHRLGADHGAAGRREPGPIDRHQPTRQRREVLARRTGCRVHPDGQGGHRRNPGPRSRDWDRYQRPPPAVPTLLTRRHG